MDQKNKITSKDIKMAAGIAKDKRYAGGNMSSAVRVINKIKSGLADHPKVEKELRKANEEKITFSVFRQQITEKHLTPAEMKKREEIAKGIERENPDMPMAKKMAIATAQAKKVAEEVEDTEGQHYCAKHVYSNMFGEGIVVEGMHAEPDQDGNIEWYAVKFNDGIKKVYTENLEIMIAEYHDNHKMKKKKMG